MDIAPERREYNMACWTLSGSLGVVVGPLLLGLAVTLGLGWRGLFGAMGVAALLLVAVTRRRKFPNQKGAGGVGLFAQRYNLGAAMWLLLAGPVALALGLPRGKGEDH